MKVIGVDGNGQYIAIVSHTEVEKVADKYYGNLKPLKVGEEFNLGTGHDFRREIQSACKGMVDATKNFNSAQSTLHRFAVMAASLPEGGSRE